MAKSKNACQHNENHKAHRNGIHKPKRQRYLSLLGVSPKFLRNARRAQKGTHAAMIKKRQGGVAVKKAPAVKK